MNWFLPAWNALFPDDRYTPDAFYSDNGYGAGAAENVADYFGIERASAYRKKNRAVDSLSVLLYGRW